MITFPSPKLRCEIDVQWVSTGEIFWHNIMEYIQPAPKKIHKVFVGSNGLLWSNKNYTANQKWDVRVHLCWLLCEDCLRNTMLTKIEMFECAAIDCNLKYFSDFPIPKFAM